MKNGNIPPAAPVDMQLNEDFLVYQANELVRSRQDELTSIEAKLIRLAISQVLKEDADFKTYTCELSRLAEFLGIDRSNAYRDIQDLGQKIMRRNIYIRDKKRPIKNGRENYKIFHWVEYFEYDSGIITIKLSDYLKPYLTGLEELFTCYSYYYVLSLPNNYSIRLYELLASFQNKAIRETMEKPAGRVIPLEENEILFSVEQLRKFFSCEDKYPNTGDFLKRVIRPALAAVNKKTPMSVSMRAIKQKKFITDLVFSFDQPGE